MDDGRLALATHKYLYLGTYATQEEAATAYDMAAIEYRGLQAITNFELSHYIKWLRPNQNNTHHPQPNPNPMSNPNPEFGTFGFGFLHLLTQSSSSAEMADPRLQPGGGASTSSALGILLQSSKFK
ncbi:unnamed protein product [Fraxinus pennsylvanica]|uniref:AP2/ERF domain-containing protein n=1 Tax=Fraxinus pennsylvanica TaxID=56036 RepID=A0AAD2DV27_9LAMI|nr:unnamed protein product [Fraxinus pennsylvanica]